MLLFCMALPYCQLLTNAPMVLLGVALRVVVTGVAPRIIITGEAPSIIITGVAPSIVITGVARSIVVTSVAPRMIIIKDGRRNVIEEKIIIQEPRCVAHGGRGIGWRSIDQLRHKRQTTCVHIWNIEGIKLGCCGNQGERADFQGGC